jgi:dynein heavy chain
MATWSKSPLYERASARSGGAAEKQTSGDSLLILSDLDERLNKRYREIRDAGERIHSLVRDNRQYLQVDENDSNTSEYWKAYVEYIDEMITDGFYAIIQCDLEFFRQETDRKNVPDPLFQILLEVHVKSITTYNFFLSFLLFFSHLKCYLLHLLKQMHPMVLLILLIILLQIHINKPHLFHV